MPPLASLSLTPGPDTLPQALAWLESVAEQQQWHPRMAFKLGLCLDEALTNILMYGFQSETSPAKEARIALSIKADGALLMLDIIDNGSPFDPTQSQSPKLAASLDEAAPGGHGLRLMRHYLHDIQYKHDNGQNHLRLTAAPDSGAS